MRFHVSCSFPASLIILLSSLSGCASSPGVSDQLLSSEYHVSQSTFFRYRPPKGWLDATAEMQAVSGHIWLVSQDYVASIMLREVSLNEQAKQLLKEEGMLSVARLIMSLESNQGTDNPASVKLGRTTFWTFQIPSPSGDAFYVALFEAENRCFEVRAGTRNEAGTSLQNLSATQLAFLSSLRW